MITTITESNQFQTSVLKPGNAIVDFTAAWCGPCKRIAPKFEELSNEYTHVRFYKLDIDDVQEAAEQYNISAMPTFVLFKDGQEVARVIGANVAKVSEELQTQFGGSAN